MDSPLRVNTTLPSPAHQAARDARNAFDSMGSAAALYYVRGHLCAVVVAPGTDQVHAVQCVAGLYAGRTWSQAAFRRLIDSGYARLVEAADDAVAQDAADMAPEDAASCWHIIERSRLTPSEVRRIVGDD